MTSRSLPDYKSSRCAAMFKLCWMRGSVAHQDEQLQLLRWEDEQCLLMNYGSHESLHAQGSAWRAPFRTCLLEVHGSCLDQVKEPSPKHVSWLQSTYLWGFWEDHRLRKLWAEGRLEFVLWDSMHECQGHLKCMQVSCSCHASQQLALTISHHLDGSVSAPSQ